MYIYEGHMGGLYTSDEPLDYEYLYCDECGDSDWLVGYAATREDELVDDVRSGNYSLNEIAERIEEMRGKII